MKPSQTCMIAFVALVSASALSAALAAGLKIQLPSDTTLLKPGAGVEVARAQCVTCHSADYIATQPRDKPLAFWKAEVEKMKKVYGAPIPDDQIDPIAEYLVQSYGTGR